MLSLLATAIALISCGDDDEGDGNGDPTDDFSCTNYETLWATSAQEVINAGLTYLNDSTEANCTAYADAMDAYIDDLELILDCPQAAGHEAEIQADLDEIQSDADEVRAGCAG